LGSATVNVTSASGEFGAAFSSPITVSGGFAVSVAKPAAATDSVYVYYTDQTDYDGFSYLYGSSMYNILSDFSADVDMVIRPTIEVTLGAPVLSASPTSICAGSGSYINYTSYPSVSWTSSSHYYLYWPSGWGTENITFGDASSGTSLPVTHTYAAAGSYTPSATVQYVGYTNNCTSDAGGGATVTVNPATFANFEWSSTNLAVNFTNLSVGATSYNWLFGDGGNATAPNPVHNYAASGTYTVELTATGPCGANTLYANISITDSTNESNVGYVELENGLLTNIYPNPSTDQLTVDLSLENAGEVALQVISSTGQIVYTKELGAVKSVTHRVDTGNYQPGIYFLRIVHDGSVSSRTFLKN
jgi:PKD repeat protein